MEGFEALSRPGVEAAKQRESEQKADERAAKSVQHTQLRKDKLPKPPPSLKELRTAERETKELLKDNSVFNDKNKIANLKITCGNYVNHFKEKYPEIGKLAKPKEGDGLDAWQTYLGEMQTIIGSQRASNRFDLMVKGFLVGVEVLNQKFPEAFAGKNLYYPVKISDVVNNPVFQEQIDDEKHEIIFNNPSWFFSGHWQRLMESMFRAGAMVAMENEKQLSREQANVVAQHMAQRARDTDAN